MKEALIRLLSSMKFWTTIIGGLVTALGSWLASHQLAVSDAAVQQFAASCVLLVSILIHAQGKTDQGKVAAKIQIDGSTAPSLNQTAAVNIPVVEEVKS